MWTPIPQDGQYFRHSSVTLTLHWTGPNRVEDAYDVPSPLNSTYLLY